MDNLKTVFANMDWLLLREQKRHLLSLQDKTGAVQGVVHLLDAIQDAAVEDGIASEETVFGFEVDL